MDLQEFENLGKKIPEENLETFLNFKKLSF